MLFDFPFSKSWSPVGFNLTITCIPTVKYGIVLTAMEVVEISSGQDQATSLFCLLPSSSPAHPVLLLVALSSPGFERPWVLYLCCCLPASSPSEVSLFKQQSLYHKMPHTKDTKCHRQMR